MEFEIRADAIGEYLELSRFGANFGMKLNTG